MRKGIWLRISASVLVIMIGAIYFAGKPETSSAQKYDGFVTYYLYVFCGDRSRPSKIFAHSVTEGGTQGRPLMGTHTECAGNCDGGTVSLDAALAELPAAVSAGLRAQVIDHQTEAEAGRTFRLSCIPMQPPPNCVKYTGEITCDCNGDGRDDITKTFESCGPGTDRPRSFKSRCEDWAKGGGGGFSYATDISLSHQGSDWLESLECPSLDCHEKYETCEGPLYLEYDTCKLNAVAKRLFGNSCLRKLNRELDKCKAARTACLNNVRRSGPPASPQPRPTPGDFRP